MASNGKAAYLHVGDVWTLQFVDGEARRGGETLEIGGAAHHLMTGGAPVFDACGRKLR